MHVKVRPTVIMRDRERAVLLALGDSEVFTPESLIAEKRALATRYDATVTLRGDWNGISFEIRPNGRSAADLQFDDYEFSYGRDGQPEAPAVLFVSRKGGAIDPRQPLSANSVRVRLIELARGGARWGFGHEGEYLWLQYGGRDLFGDHAERTLRPKFKRADMYVRAAFDRTHVSDLVIHLNAFGTAHEVFELSAVEKLPFIKDVRQAGSSISAHITNLPWLGKHGPFMTDFLYQGRVWDAALRFAHALGYHHVDDTFVIRFDERHEMTYRPPALSLRP